MRKLISLFAILLLCALPAGAQVPMTGAGLGTPTVVAGYQGPGDLGVGSFSAWFSPASAYSSTFAATAGAIADIVDTATGLATCTIKISTGGAADKTAIVCPTASPTVNFITWCTVTNVAGCSIAKLYDQTGNGKHATNATLAQMPILTLSALNGLPGWTCGSGTCFLATPSITASQPLTYSAVYKRTAPAAGSIIGDSGAVSFLGTSTANLAQIFAGTTATVSAADNAYHSSNGLASGTGNNCALNIDGSDTASLNCGTGGGTSVYRINRSNGVEMQGTTMEAGILVATTTAANRNSLSSNQHTRYGF